MSGLPCNVLGPLLAAEDVIERTRQLGITDDDRVLEVGGAANPFERADVICDISFASSAQRNGAPVCLRPGVRYVEAPAERLPFEDDAFDFVWCTQVLEHVRDPVAACRELSRVARRGFIEVPSRLGELVNGNPSHRWIIDRVGEELVFHPRRFVEHPLRNFFYGILFQDPALRRLAEMELRNAFNHQILFDGRLGCRVEPAQGTCFDYDDPEQAGRAHYSFARNVVASGGDPAYVVSDAIEAARLLGGADAPRALQAVLLARLGRAAEGRAVLGPCRSEEAGALARMLEDCSGPEEACDVPLPPVDPRAWGGVTRSVVARPLVSVVVWAEGAGDLLASAESALVQDYPRVEVVVAAAAPQPDLEQVFAQLEMGDRLRLVSLPGGSSPGACLNRGALETRGELVAFCLAGDRWMPGHLDRLVEQLHLSESPAVHGDRILLSGEGVVGPDIVPGDARSAGASLSTLLLRRDTLKRVGAFDEAAGAAAALQFLVRLAGTEPPRHVHRASVESRGPLPEGAAAREAVRAPETLDALDMMRSLMGHHVRQTELRNRIADLERRIRELGGTP